MNYDLSAGERFYLWRKRAGLTLPATARWAGVPRETVQAWQRGEREDVPRVELSGLLTPGERCAILRRRAGMLQRDVAARLGVTREWIVQQETGRRAVMRPLARFWGIDGDEGQ